MTILEGICREVVEKSEWVAIATAGPDGPHVVGTWGLLRLGIGGNVLGVPVSGMRQTEANLRRDARVEVLCGTRQVQGSQGSGRGCVIVGRAEVIANTATLKDVELYRVMDPTSIHMAISSFIGGVEGRLRLPAA